MWKLDNESSSLLICTYDLDTHVGIERDLDSSSDTSCPSSALTSMVMMDMKDMFNNLVVNYCD